MITILYILVLIFFILLAAMVIVPVFFGAPWHPLSDKNINRIIKFADLQPGETFYDLGSGDGRVLIAASSNQCLRGVGVEIDPIKVWLSRYFIIAAKLADKIRIHRGSIPLSYTSGTRPVIPRNFRSHETFRTDHLLPILHS